MNDTLFVKASGLAIVAVLVLTCIKILFPFLGAMLWGSIIAISAWPLFERLCNTLAQRRGLASFIMTSGLILIFVIPIALLVGSLSEHMDSVGELFMDLTTSPLPALPAWISKIPLIGSQLDAFWQNARMDLPTALETARPYFKEAFTWLLHQGGNLTLAVLEFLFAILLAGFMFTNQEGLKNLAERLFSRIAGQQGLTLMDTAAQTIRAVSTGVVGTALIQALLSVFGFAIAGVPGAGLLGLLCFVLAMMQIGTALIWIPVAAWLSFQGSSGWAAFTVVWGILINISDNFIKPYLISQGSNLPIPLIFLGVLGGLMTFGFIGIFVGPTLLVVCYTLLNTWLDTPVSAAAEESSDPKTS